MLSLNLVRSLVLRDDGDHRNSLRKAVLNLPKQPKWRSRSRKLSLGLGNGRDFPYWVFVPTEEVIKDDAKIVNLQPTADAKTLLIAYSRPDGTKNWHMKPACEPDIPIPPFQVEDAFGRVKCTCPLNNKCSTLFTSSEEGFIDEKHLKSAMSMLRIIFLVICMCMLYTIAHSETLSKICCQGNPNYNLAERNGDVVLTLANDSDPYQQWIINSTLGSMVRDEFGLSSISIVNKGTGHVLSHVKHNHQVVVVSYGKDDFQREYLWTQSEPKDDGYQSVLPLNNINMALQADVPVNNKSLSRGIKVSLYKRNDTEIHQKWKIMAIGPPGEVVHIYSEANTDYILTARGDFAVLALASSSDAHQEWIKVISWGERVKDEAGFPAFALVNKATLKALKHGNSEWDQTLETAIDAFAL